MLLSTSWGLFRDGDYASGYWRAHGVHGPDGFISTQFGIDYMKLRAGRRGSD